jgi:hypothetical protein
VCPKLCHRRSGIVSNRPASLLLLVLCLCCLALPTRALSQGSVVSVRVGVVTRFEGEVGVRRHRDTKLSVLQPGAGLSKGDLLITGDDGRAELTLNPGSYLRVGPLSQVWAHEVENGQIHFDILRGEVSAIVAGFIQDTSLILDTPPAELNIVKHGHYVIQVAADGSTEAYVVAGELRFVDSHGQTLLLKRHKRVRIAAPARR